FDCVYLCDVGTLSGGEIRRLDAFVRRGGGLVVTAGDNVAKHIEAYNRLLYKGDQGLLPAQILRVQQAPPDHYFTVRAPDGFNVPLLKAFDSDDQLALSRVRFQQYLRVESANDASVRKVLTFYPEALAGSKTKVDGSLPIGDTALIEWNPPVHVE